MLPGRPERSAKGRGAQMLGGRTYSALRERRSLELRRIGALELQNRNAAHSCCCTRRRGAEPCSRGEAPRAPSRPQQIPREDFPL